MHGQAAHDEGDHFYASMLDLRRAVSTILDLEARELWGLVIHLLDPFVERLYLDVRMSLDVRVHVEALTLGGIFIAHG